VAFVQAAESTLLTQNQRSREECKKAQPRADLLRHWDWIDSMHKHFDVSLLPVDMYYTFFIQDLFSQYHCVNTRVYMQKSSAS
jgi:hypothetical protein